MLVTTKDNIMFVVTIVCDKHTFVATNTSLSRQKYACRDKTFVATNVFITTNICHNKHNFVETKKNVTTKDKFCHDKHMFVMTKHIFCRNKTCHNKNSSCGSSHQ